MNLRAVSLVCLLPALACSPATEPGTPSGNLAGASGAADAAASSNGGSAGAGTSGSSGGGASAGASNSAGAGGVSGSASNSAGAGGQTAPSDRDAAQPSLGCNKSSELEPGRFISSTSLGRPTWVRLPSDYDPARAYPLIFVWKGCSSPGITSYGLETVAGADAIIAQGDFPPGADCYDTADNAMYVDLPIFDAMLQQIETNYCVDKAHVFSVGFSSGAWLTQLLACQRGDVLRGIGTIAGAFKPAFMKGAASCVGSGMSAFMVSDLSDTNNPFHDTDNDGDSVEVAVNHWLGVNGCTEKAWSMDNGTPAMPDPAVCRAYGNCGKNPVELCLTSGKGHAAQEDLSMPGFWQLFQQSLPK